MQDCVCAMFMGCTARAGASSRHICATLPEQQPARRGRGRGRPVAERAGASAAAAAAAPGTRAAGAAGTRPRRARARPASRRGWPRAGAGLADAGAGAAEPSGRGGRDDAADLAGPLSRVVHPFLVGAPNLGEPLGQPGHFLVHVVQLLQAGPENAAVCDLDWDRGGAGVGVNDARGPRPRGRARARRRRKARRGLAGRPGLPLGRAADGGGASRRLPTAAGYAGARAVGTHKARDARPQRAGARAQWGEEGRANRCGGGRARAAGRGRTGKLSGRGSCAASARRARRGARAGARARVDGRRGVLTCGVRVHAWEHKVVHALVLKLVITQEHLLVMAQ